MDHERCQCWYFWANDLFIFVFDIVEQRDLISSSPVGINEKKFVKKQPNRPFSIKKTTPNLIYFVWKCRTTTDITSSNRRNPISACIKYQKVFWTVKTLYAVTSMTRWLCTVTVIKIHPQYTKLKAIMERDSHKRSINTTLLLSYI